MTNPNIGYLLTLCILFLYGCSDGVIYLDSLDSAQCTIECKQKIQEKWCDSGYSNFGSMCRCIMLNCLKKVEIEKQPKNFTDFKIESTIQQSNSLFLHNETKNQECYQNDKKINCTKIINFDDVIHMAKKEKTLKKIDRFWKATVGVLDMATANTKTFRSKKKAKKWLDRG